MKKSRFGFTKVAGVLVAFALAGGANVAMATTFEGDSTFEGNADVGGYLTVTGGITSPDADVYFKDAYAANAYVGGTMGAFDVEASNDVTVRTGQGTISLKETARQVTDVDGRVTALGFRVSAVQAAAKQYADDAESNAQAYTNSEIGKVDTKISKVKADAQSYADQAAGQALADAKEYTDTAKDIINNAIASGDQATLESAKEFAQAEDRKVVTEANAYTDSKTEKVAKDAKAAADAIKATIGGTHVNGKVLGADNTISYNLNKLDQRVTSTEYNTQGISFEPAGAGNSIGSTVINQNLDVKGSVQSNGIANTGVFFNNGDSIVVGNSQVGGKTTTGELQVIGASTTNGITNKGSIATDSIVVNQDAVVHGNTVLGGNLAVIGETTMIGKVSANDVEVQKDLEVKGNAKAGSLTLGGKTVNKIATVEGASKEANSTLSTVAYTDEEVGKERIRAQKAEAQLQDNINSLSNRVTQEVKRLDNKISGAVATGIANTAAMGAAPVNGMAVGVGANQNQAAVSIAAKVKLSDNKTATLVISESKTTGPAVGAAIGFKF